MEHQAPPADPSSSPPLRIVHDVAASRYDIFVGSDRGGFAEYEIDGSTITFTHTVTVPRLRGNGLAARVVARALDDARAAGQIVVPQCWFVAEYIDDHPEYRDLLSPSDRR